MNWDLVQLFIEVVDAGSMSEAARRRGVTRSGVSQRLKQLEREVKAQLLRRNTRDLEPTSIGRALYERGRRIALEFEAANAELAALGGTLSGLVRVRMPPGIGQQYLAPVLAEFAREHPEVRFRITFNNRFRNLIEGGIDVAVLMGSEPPPETVCREAGPVRWQFFCTPAYRDGLPRLAEPGDLAKAAFLSPHEERRMSLELISDRGPACVALTPYLSSENVLFLRSWALAGMGVALLPTYLTIGAVSSGELVKVLPEFRGARLASRMFILTVPNRFPTPALHAVIDLLGRTISRILAEANV